MDDDYGLRKFTNEDLNNFEKIAKQALTMPFVKESAMYLLTEIYRFGNYVIDRTSEESKKGIILREKSEIANLDIYEMLKRIEESEEDLTLEERIFFRKIKNLTRLQLAILKLDFNYPNAQTRNMQNNLLEVHHQRKDEIKKELEQNADLKEIPSRCLKKLAKEFCELLIKNGTIAEILEETKLEKRISNLVIPEMEKIYEVTARNKRSIHLYFRRLDLKLEKDKKRKLVVTDTYIRIKIKKKV